MDVTAKHNEVRPGLELAFFQHFRQRLLARARRMATPQEAIFRIGVRRMMQQEEDKIDIVGKVIELAGQPLSLRTGRLILRAVQNQRECAARPHGVIAAVLQLRKALEVIPQTGDWILVKLVIADGGENRDLGVGPRLGFGVPDRPIGGVITL